MPPSNVLIVTVDCLRRDRLSAYGYERKTTPFLDGILDRALHCTSAHSASSWTCPSVASLLTGLYPHRHGGGLVPGEPKNLSKESLPTALQEDVPSLPDMLEARGYATNAIAAVWNAHLSIPGRFRERSMVERPARTLVRRALRWIGAQDGPFLLWLHLGDAHEPLDFPRGMRETFGPVPRIRKVRRWDYTRSGADVGSAAFARYRDARVRLYDVAVRAADGGIAELWDGLDGLGRRGDTIVVVTSDHGEELWEHRAEEMEAFTDPRDIYGTGHGHNLFQVHLLVPLVILGPGIPAAAIEENASLVDVVPTLLQAVEMDAPETDGRSLLERGGQRPIIAEAIAYGFEKKSVVMDDLKLLHAPGDGFERVYRLGADRREAGGLQDPAEADRLRGLLPRGPSIMGEQVEATDEIVEHLRALGYLE
ncbi:MAG: sulfatase [Actinomycetota bacterium]